MLEPKCKYRCRSVTTITLVVLFTSACSADELVGNKLSDQFTKIVRPFLKSYCTDCHGKESQEAKLDLSGFTSADSVANAHQTWAIVLERLRTKEMPPQDAADQPDRKTRQAVIEWVESAREFEAKRNAGDPGPVLVRRLSNAEYNYSIRDLTGVDIRPTSTFPVDPANESGFDNSGESLTMSPALLKKYLAAARQVADHLVLKPDGIAFAPHTVVTDTDRDKYCVKRIVEFYLRQPTDYADYFLAAWHLRVRTNSDIDSNTINALAVEREISPKYLNLIWAILHESNHHAGPMAEVIKKWQALPADGNLVDNARKGCREIDEFIVQSRKKLVPKIANLDVEGIHKGSQTFVLWRNRQRAETRRSFSLDMVAPGNKAGDAKEAQGVDNHLVLPAADDERRLYQKSLEQFCSVFPNAFYISERGRDYVDDARKQMGEKGRLLSAGFHSMMGYFRDDAPLYDMILDESEQHELDRLWQELDFVASAPMRQYVGFLWFERTDSKFMRDEVFDFARPENKTAQTEELIKQLADVYLEKARTNGAEDIELKAVADYFQGINEQIRWVEQARAKAEPSHLKAVIDFASRAYRRKLSRVERKDLADFYQDLRKDGVDHEGAIQDTLVSVLMSPFFCYRIDLAGSGSSRRHLRGEELASRLSYFLWSSMPDRQLLRKARSGKLNSKDQLTKETRRMLSDDRVMGFAREFAGNWLDIRRFEQHNAVDRERFPEFTDDLRQAMFEEPLRFFADVVKNDRSVLDFLNADDTFVNAALARHYGVDETAFDAKDESPTQRAWVRIDNARQFGRGGLLPMSVFLTRNSPGLRTSPVKRGYWVVRRLLGERIPPPPPNVPELPEDESQLGELTLPQALAKHRDNESCAGCHNRIDAIGLAFEGYGPIGERRKTDLGGRPVSNTAVFPEGEQGIGIDGLRRYLRKHRQEEFLDNLCRKLLSYALSRSLILSDELLIRQMRRDLEAKQFRFTSLIDTIVNSSQFLNKRDGGDLALK